MHLGNVLYLLGRKEADAEFSRAIDIIKQNEKSIDSNALYVLGWCFYRKKNYNEAINLIVDAITLNNNLIHAKFDLALVLLVSGQYAFALEAYRNSIDYAIEKNEFLSAGWISVAKINLIDALKEDYSLKEHGEEVLELMEAALRRVKPLVSNLA
jgi:tetratricopeptide (TPR) repeat protein